MPELGKLLLVVGVVLIVLGVALLFGDRIPFFRLGRLPGDIVYRRGNFTFYFPLITSILLSLVLSAVLWFFSRR
ncbi:MAG TPA: DUF2905 domain-containing protein [Terriglobia bacterium]|nr:DUF2905 domain-containing protein [Terriglobia bacterium]